MHLAGNKPRIRKVDFSKLVIACAGCGEQITNDVRISPEGAIDVIYVPPCPACYFPKLRRNSTGE